MFRIIPHRAFIEPRASVASTGGAGANSTATLRIEGLLCSACAANVKRRVEAVPGVSSVDVSLDRGEADVRYDASRTTPEALAAAVEGAVILRPLRRLLARLSGHASS
jgi:copper chaperone CopZ